MHIFFSGIGAGTGPLALIAHQAGYTITCSDKQESSYTDYVRTHTGSVVYIGQTEEAIAEVHAKNPIDWLVYSSSVEKEHTLLHSELNFATNHGIRLSKRDEFLAMLLKESNQKMIAIAGTHGKTTTTAMMIWLLSQLQLPTSYSVGAKLPFGDMGAFSKEAEYFVYEADEYDRNFLAYTPALSLIAGIDYDHPDIYPTRESYYEAFHQFLDQSTLKVLWQADAARLGLQRRDDTLILIEDDEELQALGLIGRVNRMNAYIVATAASWLGLCDFTKAETILKAFPGVSRRFEQISPGIFSDYAHTPEKIKGALQIAEETAPGRVVVVYEGLHNTRQHFIREDLPTLFTGAKKLYIVPSYLAREDTSLELLTPQKLCAIITDPVNPVATSLSEELAQSITSHVADGDIVLCLTAGGGGSLDEWLRTTF